MLRKIVETMTLIMENVSHAAAIVGLAGLLLTMITTYCSTLAIWIPAMNILAVVTPLEITIEYYAALLTILTTLIVAVQQYIKSPSSQTLNALLRMGKRCASHIAALKH
jgi:hypothetical protein